ncbi:MULTISPECIES: dihydrolipoamide acetyltransferase family protein [Rhodococcus]|uniref:Dihydrolipoamide acetyltransferase component of pyruvate dehydrogenase complex n=1 Tax=Rhodococcus qingshengii JCM 15477 TaxID=1303681 RepID=A0AB38R7G3_RHOSG|nr:MULTISPECIES: dihydrolipoamide acetyltransferase family protein [Rhodococcus]UPU41193.1 2-oxo acid dehydrogenase subunit E2 [Rhodococcus qingshengii JCM 15477]
MSTGHEFRLPDLGEGLTSADLVEWTVGVGDTVALNQVLAQVETAKALVELPSPYVGVVRDLLVEPGTTVPVGTPIIRIEEPADSPSPSDSQSPSVLVGYGPAAERPSRRRSKITPASQSAANTERQPATPAARRAAREAGIELSEITGSGFDGAVTAADVADALTVQAPSDNATRLASSGLRKQMASAMVASVRAPQASVFLTADITPSMELLGRLRSSEAFTGLSLTPLTLAAKAMVAAIASHPMVNAHWDEARGDAAVDDDVNLGIAVASERGLSVPNIKSAETLSLVQLARAVTELTVAAREGKTDVRHLTGGTVTITNVGVFGVEGGIPLLNPGEAVILCLGSVSERPWVIERKIEVRSVVTLTLTFDHRVLTGEQAARFLSFVAEMLANPDLLLTHL